MKKEKIKPIPKYILDQIERTDKKANYKPCGKLRFYAYLTKNDGELCKITCAVKVYKNKWYCKQVAVHGIHSSECFCRDIEYSFMGGYRVGFSAEGMPGTPKWFEDGKWYNAEDKYFKPFAYLINPQYAYKYPEFKYSACELYKGDDIIEYLRVYEQYPQAEYLVKLGLSGYALSTQILRKVATDKKFRTFLANNRNELNDPCYYVSTILSAYKTNKTLKDAQIIESLKKTLCTDKKYEPLRLMIRNDYKRYNDYIIRQNTTNAIYLDYLNACLYLGIDMNEDKNRYPHDFKRWHDIRIDEYDSAKALQDKKERAEFYEKFAEIANKYLPMCETSKGNYIVIIAKSPLDLMEEGKTLHHCVGKMGYDRKFVREESLIFFVRSKENTDTPLATIEYSLKSKKINQCYADKNSTPDQAIMDYVNNIWMPYAEKALRKIAA